ncbi:hypothetical protein D3C71_1791560 [compost metagenome]
MGRGEEVPALAVRATEIRDPVQARGGGFAPGERRGWRFAADTEQRRGRVVLVEDRQVQVVMAHHLVQQRVRLERDIAGSHAHRQTVLELLHLFLEAVFRHRVEFMGQRQERQHRQQHHQHRAQDAHRQPQPHRQAGRLHSLASNT